MSGVEFFISGGSLLGRIQGDREPVSFLTLLLYLSIHRSWRNAENSASEENIRLKADPFHKVGKKAEEIQQQLSELASEYHQLHANAVNLKAEVMKV